MLILITPVDAFQAFSEDMFYLCSSQFIYIKYNRTDIIIKHGIV